MQTKGSILRFFAEHLPDFAFIGERRPNLVFRSERGDGLYWLLAVQRDGPACGLAVQLAATYNPEWRGEPASPLGFDAGLQNLRLRSRAVEAMEAWFLYKPTTEGLSEVLREIQRQLVSFGLPFLANAERRLRTNHLLQAALAAAKGVPAESRAGLTDAAVSVGYSLDELKHPAYLQMCDHLQATVTSGTSDDERMWIKRLAYDCLTIRTTA